MAKYRSGSGRQDKQGLCRGHFLEALDTEFDADAGLLDAAERRIGLDRAVAINPN